MAGASGEAWARSTSPLSSDTGANGTAAVGRSAVSGSAVHVPEPCRLEAKPWLRTASYAAVIVVRLTPRTRASSRSPGNRVASGSRPSSTSIRIEPASWA